MDSVAEAQVEEAGSGEMMQEAEMMEVGEDGCHPLLAIMAKRRLPLHQEGLLHQVCDSALRLSHID